MRTLLLSLILSSCLITSYAQIMSPLEGDSTYFHPNNHIYSVTVDKFNNLYAGGNFTDTSGKYYVSKWNGTAWSALGTGASALIPNGVINTLKTDTDGYVYAAGTILSGGWYKVMRWTGQQWSMVSDTLGSDTILNGQIMSITIDRRGYLYAAGYMKDSTSSYCIAKWDGNRWSKLQSTSAGPFNNCIYTITTDTFGNIYVAGAFKNAAAKNYVAKWDGSSWSEIGSGISGNGFNGNIRTVAVDSRGNIYAGGDFTNTSSREYIAKWNGSSWTEQDSGSTDLHSARSIQSIIIDTADNIYATGGFFNANSRPYVAKWDGHTCGQIVFENSFFHLSGLGTRACLAMDKHNNIYQGGLFGNPGGEYLGAYIVPIPRQYLCLATVDTNIGKPVIIWEKADKYSADSFIIYRAVRPDTIYTIMTIIQRDSLSQWIDQSALSDSLSYRYKIAVKDTAGAIDSLSPYHQTMCLRSLGQGQYAVTPYIIEDDTISAGSLYTLYRDSLGTGDWSIVGALPATYVTDTLLTATDPFYMLFPNANYKVVLTLNYSCHASRAVSIVTSNILRRANSTVSVEGIKASELVSMTPNPVHDVLTVTTTSPYAERLTVINAPGQVIYRSEVNNNIQNIDTRSWDAGIYFISLSTREGTYIKRIVRF